MSTPKFKYELQELENIIVIDLSTFIEDESRVDDWLIDDFKEALKRKTEKIKMNMQQSIIGYKDDTREEYIQYHQQAIIRLTVYLTTYGVPNPAPPSINSSGIELLSYHILLALEDLLSFVETRYARYFDPDTWLPQNYLSLTAAELHTELDNLHLNLLAIGVERDFAGIIMQPFWKFAVAQSNSGGTTYSHTSYLKHLKLELEKVINNGATGNVTKTLHILLNGLNFNSPEYFTYCTTFIQQELKKAEGNDTDELYVLSRFYKYLHQVPVQLGAVLDPSRPSLFDLLDEWLRAEREYIEMNIPTAIAAPSVQGVTAGFKILMAMTITQLSYFFHVLIQTGAILNKNKSMLTRFTAVIFQATTKDKMSDGNARKKLYAKNDGVRQAVRAVLVRCIQYIDADTGENDRK